MEVSAHYHRNEVHIERLRISQTSMLSFIVFQDIFVFFKYSTERDCSLTRCFS